jgi:hypothetical protein
VLETAFQKNRYPNATEVDAITARVALRRQQVGVGIFYLGIPTSRLTHCKAWFTNRRAHDYRTRPLSGLRLVDPNVVGTQPSLDAQYMRIRCPQPDQLHEQVEEPAVTLEKGEKRKEAELRKASPKTDVDSNVNFHRAVLHSRVLPSHEIFSARTHSPMLATH